MASDNSIAHDALVHFWHEKELPHRWIKYVITPSRQKNEKFSENEWNEVLMN